MKTPVSLEQHEFEVSSIDSESILKNLEKNKFCLSKAPFLVQIERNFENPKDGKNNGINENQVKSK